VTTHMGVSAPNHERTSASVGRRSRYAFHDGSAGRFSARSAGMTLRPARRQASAASSMLGA
jgi:hypothetical protein